MKSAFSLSVSLVVLFLANFAFADTQAPECLAYGKSLEVNNQQVLHWERTTGNQFQERGHVTGQIVMLFHDKNGHNHFEIQLGKNDDDVLEIIYNQEFGALPNLSLGMNVEACGDYITATEQSGPYPPSPAGAILHWVHMNPKASGHPAGFLMINGNLYGQDIENAGDKRSH